MTNQPDLNGKTILITGASGGIGSTAAAALAKMGARLVLVGRSAQKMEALAGDIKNNSGNEAVEVLLGDLSLMSDVRRVAAAFLERHSHLDVLVNNAGALIARKQITAEGLEMTFALNVLSPFLLTHLLMEALKAAAPARIINTSSVAHLWGQVDFPSFIRRDWKIYEGTWVYGQSKLADLFLTYELARRLEGFGVSANALHPGFVATNFGKSNGGLAGAFWAALQIFAISPQEGARTTTYLASSPEVEGVSGKYFVRCKAVRSGPVSYDRKLAAGLWNTCTELCALKQ